MIYHIIILDRLFLQVSIIIHQKYYLLWVIKTVTNIVQTKPTMGCHHGRAVPVAIRSIIVVGVAGGKSENPVAIGPNGSRTMKIQTNIGLINNIHTGNNIDWASLSCETEAPMAMKIEA